MGAMPELISSRDASFWGMREKLGRRRWPLDSKNFRNISRSSFTPKGLGFFMKVPPISKISFLHKTKSLSVQGRGEQPRGTTLIHPIRTSLVIR
jgi:hypothetical protein